MVDRNGELVPVDNNPISITGSDLALSQSEQKSSSTIDRVQMTREVFEKYQELFRQFKANEHNLIVLLGEPGQKGNTRTITEALIVKNPVWGNEFKDFAHAAYRAIDLENERRVKQKLPPLNSVGVGTVVGMDKDVESILQLYKGKFDLFWAGGTELPKTRTAYIKNEMQGRIYTLDSSNQVTMVPKVNLFTPGSNTTTALTVR